MRNAGQSREAAPFCRYFKSPLPVYLGGFGLIRRVAAEFQNRVEVQPYFWEYEPMESTRDYQENIPLTSDFDLVICILWKRLGSPLSVKHQRPEGGRWCSGTEFELVTAIESKKARGAPDLRTRPKSSSRVTLLLEHGRLLVPPETIRRIQLLPTEIL